MGQQKQIKPTKQIVIIGAGYAGMMAALRLANKTRRQPVAITLINAQDRFVERIRNHQLATKQTLRDRPIRQMLNGTGVTFVEATVTALDPTIKQVTVQAQGATRNIAYDKLVYALGSFTDKSRVPGVADYAYTLDQTSATALRERLPEVAARGGRVLVVGSGLTGIESSSEIAEAYPGLYVELVTDGTLDDDLSKPGADYLRHIFAKLGVTVREQTTISRLETNHAIAGDGSSLPFDICLWATGFTVSPLARQAGIGVNAAGRIVIDARLRSVSHPDVYAVGDAAAFQPGAGLSLRMACATAMPMATHAAENLAALVHGKAEQPFKFGFGGRCISLGRRHGLVQFVDVVDKPQPSVITGKAGAVIKELICRYTTTSLAAERRGINIYFWPHSLSAEPTQELKAAIVRS